MKKLLKKLTTRFISPDVKPKDYLCVIDINTPAEDVPLHEVLGCTKERHDEIKALVKQVHHECAKKEESIVIAMKIISPQLKHANELFLASLILIQTNQPPSIFDAIFKRHA